MALTTQGFVTPGAQSLAAKYGIGGSSAPAGAAAPTPPTQEEFTVWDELATYFTDRGIPVGAIGPDVMPLNRPSVDLSRLPAGTVPAGVTGGTYTGDWKDSIRPVSPEENAAREWVHERARKRVRLKALAEQAGLDPDNPIELAEFWIKGVTEAQAAAAVSDGSSPEELVWNILTGWSKNGFPGTIKAEEAEKQRMAEYYEGQGYTTTSTSKNIQLTDPDTARALVTGYLQQELGRKPSDSEIKDFTAALNKKERANPTVTKTVAEYGFDADTGSFRQMGSDTTTTGGPPSPGAFASNYVEDEHSSEEKAYQAIQYSSIIDQLLAG